MSVHGGAQMKQLSLFDTDKETIKITKPIRLIELFAGYGSQAMAMKRLGVNFETYRMIEFDKYAVNSYIHNMSQQILRKFMVLI